MDHLKNEQNQYKEKEQESFRNSSNQQKKINKETTAQNDGFRYDYDDSSDL